MVKILLVGLCLSLLVGCSSNQNKLELIRYSRVPNGEVILPEIDTVVKDISLYAQLSDIIPDEYTLHSAEWIKDAIKNREQGSWKLDELPSLVADVQTVLSALDESFVYTQTENGWVFMDVGDDTYQLILTRTEDNAVFVYTV